MPPPPLSSPSITPCDPSLSISPHTRMSSSAPSSASSSSSSISLAKAATAAGASVLVVAAAAALTRRLVRGPERQVPPDAPEDPVDVLFGRVEGKDHGEEAQLMDPPVRRADPWFWMRDDERKSDKVLTHLKQENAYTNWKTRGGKGRRGVYREMLTHFQESDSSVPATKGPFLYYSRTEKGKSYPMYCRKKAGDQPGVEQVLLDVNEVAKGETYCEVGACEVSPEGTVLAYTVDLSGYETYEVRFVDLATGKLVQAETIRNTYGGVVWGKDGSEVYYQTFDGAHRPHQVWRHTLKSFGHEGGRRGGEMEDVCLYTEKDSEFNLYVSKALSGRFLFLGSFASTVSEHRFVDLDKPEAGVHLVREREEGVLYDVVHGRGDTFYVVTNGEEATNFQVMVAQKDEPGKWMPFLEYDSKRKVDDVVAFKNFLVVVGRQGGYRELWVLPDHEPNRMFQVPLEEQAHTVGAETNLEYDVPTFRFHYSSLTTPQRVFEFNVADRSAKLLKEKPVPNYDREAYKTERLEATSVDGVKIPISLVYNAKAVQEDQPNFLHLYGYGSYEISIDPSFSMMRLPLLDRGVVFAIAHVRGGGEYGREWYEAAKFETKKKTFEDFCACAQYLVDEKRTLPTLMSMEGRSAGGLLVGAVMNMRPDLFKACIAGVPFVDVLNTMSDPSIPLTTGEWQEWGNPHQKKYFDAISEYCPYSNVGPKPYPAVLILAGLFDPRVMYSEPAKWAAKLRKYSTSGEPVLLKVDLSSGHFSASDRYRALRERSFELSWLINQMGIPKNSLVPPCRN